jgi:PiT family inorganic phosphate transporter
VNHPVPLILIAITFAVVTGANEGGAIMAMGLRQPALRPVGAIAVLVAGVVFAPVLLGTGVAQTLSGRLVTFESGASRGAFGVGLCAALAVVGVLTVSGIPTSLSLALIGGIAGAGLGYGLPVSWHGMITVLVFGAVAPLIGGVVGGLLTRLMRWMPAGRRLTTVVEWATLGGYLAQALAYGANGGQKMLAVFAVSDSAGHVNIHTGLGKAAFIGGCFAIGTVLSLRRLAGRLSRDLMVVRPVHALSAEFASSAAVLASMAAGMPASMTESIASALVGAGVSQSTRRVRWKAVGRLGVAWLVTLPASVAVAAGASALVHGLG